MSSNLEVFILAFVPSLLASVLTAFITVRLALRQFYSQRWWERKAEAYSAVVEALTGVAYALNRSYSKEFEGRDISDDESTAMWEQFWSSRQEIEKQIHAGQFIMSEAAVKALVDLVAELGRSRSDGNWLDDLDRHFAATQSTLANISRLAKADLKMNRWGRS